MQTMRVGVQAVLAGVLLMCLAEGPTHAAVRETTETLPLDQVRVGMKGYGMSVFQGTRIEPFALEVVSVMDSNFLTPPEGSMIWIRCTGERMRHFGPVFGMSGSPIYLWDENEPHKLGRGGRLIGAFAMGFMGSKDCLVGVRPIEEMRQVGARARTPTTQEQRKAAAAGSGPTAGALLGTLLKIARDEQLGPNKTWRLSALARLVGYDGSAGPPVPSAKQSMTPWPAGWEGRPIRLRLPVALHSAHLARSLGPLFEPLGFVPVPAVVGTIASNPPAWIDPEAIRLEPGSVLSVPLAFGDMNLDAAGTVTEVRPDGTVLAFGHAMDGRGPATLPMATGYVHFVLPHHSGSAKMGGSARIVGGLVRDETSAVAGLAGIDFSTATSAVTVKMPDLKAKTYRFEVIHDKRRTPLIAAILAAQCLTGVHKLPTENTIRIRGRLRFEGGRQLEVSRLVPLAMPMHVMLALVPPMLVMSLNEYGPMYLEDMNITLEVEEKVRAATIIKGRLDRGKLRPGEALDLTVWVKKHGAVPEPVRISLGIPGDTPDGRYEVVVCDAKTYLGRYLANRPHLVLAKNQDELFDSVRLVSGVKSDALYVMMNLPAEGLAVGREELPRLPSSHRAMIAPPTSTVATAYQDWVEKKVDMDVVPTGQLLFKVDVSRIIADR